jgi:hypothetical protein
MQVKDCVFELDDDLEVAVRGDMPSTVEIEAEGHYTISITHYKTFARVEMSGPPGGLKASKLNTHEAQLEIHWEEEEPERGEES